MKLQIFPKSRMRKVIKFPKCRMRKVVKFPKNQSRWQALYARKCK